MGKKGEGYGHSSPFRLRASAYPGVVSVHREETIVSKYKDTILGAVVILISIVLFIASFFIQEFTRTSLGAGFVPKVTAIIFCCLGIVLIVRERRAAPKQVSAAAPPPPAKVEGLTGPLPVVLNILLFVVYLLLLEKVGFTILTPIYMFLQILLLSSPARFRPGWYAVLSVIVGVASYYMFVNFFQVMLPNGILS